MFSSEKTSANTPTKTVAKARPAIEIAKRWGVQGEFAYATAEREMLAFRSKLGDIKGLTP